MKKFMILLCLVLVPMSAYARSGDIAGTYYSTDIKTYLNDLQIDAINIGGQTLISAEDMCYHGFNVWWDPDERTLRVDENKYADIKAQTEPEGWQLPSGTPLGNYFETDIITYLDALPITAYNIGGRTYMHAEEMRNFGYLVDWNAIERTLKIVSPFRAGFVYNIGLSYGVDKGYGAQSPGIDGIGVCSVKYTTEGLFGTDDADYFDLTMYSTGREYTFSMAFYQNKGLFNSFLLQDKLRPLCYDGYGVEVPCRPEEKYDLVNETVTISINGQKAEKVKVIGGAGSGHRDFYFVVSDLPKYRMEEITQIVFSVGESLGEPYEIKAPDYVGSL